MNYFFRMLHKINGSSRVINKLEHLNNEIKNITNSIRYIKKDYRDIKKDIHTIRLDIYHIANKSNYIDVWSENNKNIESADTPIKYTHFSGLHAPVYIMANGRAAFKIEQGETNARGFIVSIPKSGTYLTASIIEYLGMVNTNVHMFESGFSDYRYRSIPEMISQHERFKVHWPFSESVDIIQPGQFSVGHIPYNKETCSALKEFKLILMIREIRSVFISLMRWYSNEGRGEEQGIEWKKIGDKRERLTVFLSLYCEELIKRMELIAGWYLHPNILVIRFEDLYGDSGERSQIDIINQISTLFGFDDEKLDKHDLLKKVINQPTKTWSGKRSNLKEYWSSQSEKIFIQNGGNKINALLGYQDVHYGQSQ